MNVIVNCKTTTEVQKQDFNYLRPFRRLIYEKGYRSILQIPYVELLNTREWFVKRIQILNRDNFFCKTCGAGETEFEQKGLYLIPFEHLPSPKEWTITLKEGYQVFDYAINGDSHHPIYLHVHHKYYIKDKLPWDYPDDALITMCAMCHFEFHQNNYVDIFDQLGNKLQLNPCYRCKGAGIFPEFDHIIGGLCFRCKGAKFEEYILP